jgi:transcriptional antiterminator Rof (Rho-off)
VGFAKAKHNNKTYELKRVRYDIYKDELEYDVAGSYFRLSDQITEFSCGDGTFRNGFANVESLTGRHFYQIVYDGNTKLLKRIVARVATEKLYGSASETKRFLKDEALFVQKNGTLTRLKKDKKAILELLADKQPALEAFVKEQKLKLNKEEDIVKILEKYDGL